MTEEQIRTACLQEPETGAGLLFDAYYNYVYAIVYRRLSGIGSREDVEECVSDVFLDVLRMLPQVRCGALQAYIGTAARHKAANTARSIMAHRRHTVSLDDEQMPEPTASDNVAAQTEAAEQSRRLLDAIESLGEPDASILIQKFYYDRNAAEIGRILGMNPITVRSRCARALKKLRTMLPDIR